VDADLWVGRRGSWNLMRTSGHLPDTLVHAVGRLAGVERVEALQVALLPAEVDGDPRTLLVVGIDPGAESAAPPEIFTGRGLSGPGEVVLDRSFGRRAGRRVGGQLKLAGRPLRVVGFSRDTNLLVTQYAFVSRTDLQTLVGAEDRCSFLLVRAADGVDREALARRVETEIAGVAAYGRLEFLQNNRREIESGFLPVLWAMAALGLAAGAVVVALMTYSAVLEKRSDYALLAALGCGDRTRSLVVGEQAAASAVLGGALGLVLLCGLQAALPYLIPEVEFRLDGVLAFAGMGGAMVIALLGSVVPARLASRVPPMEAFRR
jgi:putative ABC transport system permease protein